MQVFDTPITGLKVIEPRVFEDKRGYFFESYSLKALVSAGIDAVFVQDNQSSSPYGVMRGLHFQKGQDEQAKLVRVTQGKVLDVAVDIRPGSATYGQHYAVELTSENRRMLFIPRGFAHGFIVLSDTAVFSYKCDNYYNKEAEGGLRYNDPALAINWRIAADEIQVNDRDKHFPLLAELQGLI